MPYTAEAATLCANPDCTQEKNHPGLCTGNNANVPTYAMTITHLAREYRSYGDAGELIPADEYVGIVNRLHAAADRAGIDRPDAARDLFDEINAEPVEA